jgi:hypothetical protein
MMAAFTSVTLSNRTGTGATLTFNAASIDLNAAQIKQLHLLVQRMVVESACGGISTPPATVTVT